MPEVRLGNGKASAAQVPQAESVVATVVVGVAAQRLFIVIYGREGGVAVLFEVQPGEVKLLCCLYLGRLQGRFGGIGHGAYLVGLGVP